MLMAEIYRKGLEEARNHEDYLTSAVFSHLRYLPPSEFWEDLFRLAKGLPGVGGVETALAQVAAQAGVPVNRYSELRAHFWRNHPILGEPDLLLVFSAEGLRPLVVLVEAKLWSGKSGTGEWDQLARYLRLLDDLPALHLGLAAGSFSCLVYLTPRESADEIEDTLAQAQCQPADRQRIFRLRWQDVVRVAREAYRQAGEPTQTILFDVMRFLQRLGLEYFDGFQPVDALADIEIEPLACAATVAERFRGFTELELLPVIEVEEGGWGQ
jgi:hypothetical protein